MLAGRAIHDVVGRATRHQPEVRAAVAQVQHAAPRIKALINEVTSAMAVRSIPRNAVTEEFERKFPAIFRAAVVQGAHAKISPPSGAARAGHPGGVTQMGAAAGRAAKGTLSAMAEKALFIAALENAIDEAEQSQMFSLSNAISSLCTKLEHLRPELREDLQELTELLDTLQNVTQASHQLNMGVISNIRR